MVRYNIQKGKAFVSVYLDCFDNLGVYGEPYWEVYPYDDDIYRCDMKDTKKLLRAINHSIKQQEIK